MQVFRDVFPLLCDEKEQNLTVRVIIMKRGFKTKRRAVKALVGSLMTAAMTAASVTGVIAPVSANADELLGATDFEDGVGLPWHTCTTLPAKQDFEIKNGAYTVRIINNLGTNGRWDLQFRHRGLQIQKGHTYHIHAEITPSEDGYIYSAIGN